MRCKSMECFSEAIAVSVLGGHALCIECAIRVVRLSGPAAVTSIPGKPFPWDIKPDGVCTSCGTPWSKYLIGMTGDCPNCRVDIPMYQKMRSQKTKTITGFDYDEVDVKYEEGQGND